MTTGHADHVGRNRTHWDRLSTEYAEWAPRAWVSDEATWGIWRLEWSGDESMEFALPFGEWLRLFRATGFDVLDLIELRPPAGATSRYPHVTSTWARRRPSEEIWRLRKRP